MFYSNVYTVESVTIGHPDKLCDQISDTILDECLRQDPGARVAVESFGGHGLLVIAGEVTSTAHVDYETIARSVYRGAGYDDELRIVLNIVAQSLEISRGVDTGGAGDQGIMYGYATDETPEFLPKGVVLVHGLTRGLENLRTTEDLSWLRPDGKAQVTIENGRVKTVLVSAQNDGSKSDGEIRELLSEKLIRPLVGYMDEVEVFINPTGRFVQGGFAADTGLTGRKIMVDTYGGLISHGGGCFSGKDATKVDRSGAYMARFAAKNLVAHGFARECLVSVAYAIGKVEPLMILAENEREEDLSPVVREKFDFRPKAIIERFGLRRPLFRQTATYGHFGKTGLPWEEIVTM